MSWSSLLAAQCVFGKTNLHYLHPGISHAKSHQPSGLGWFSVGCLCLSGFNPLGRGLPLPLPPLPGLGSPRDSGVVGSWSVLSAILLPFFFQSFFRCHFWSIFGRFFTPTWHPKSTKIAQKSMPRCIPSWTPFFNRFLVGFRSQLGRLWSKKTSFFLEKNAIFWKHAFRS